MITPISKRILIRSKNCSYGYLYFYLEYSEKPNYKEVRRKLLQECCQIAKVDYFQLDYIIGIAFTPIKEIHIGNDFVYIDFTLWDTDDYNEAKELKELHIQDGLCK